MLSSLHRFFTWLLHDSATIRPSSLLLPKYSLVMIMVYNSFLIPSWPMFHHWPPYLCLPSIHTPIVLSLRTWIWIVICGTILLVQTRNTWPGSLTLILLFHLTNSTLPQSKQFSHLNTFFTLLSSTFYCCCRFRRLVSSVFEPLVIFIDDRHLQQVTHIVMETRPRALYTAIVPINTSFLVKYIHAWKFLPRERDIMTSNAYLRQVPMSLRHLPEHTVPSYTLINHAKIDFVMFVITHLHGRHDIGHGHDKYHQPLPMDVGYDRYSWIDFGYLHADHFMPQGPFRPHLLASDNITYMTLRPLGQ